MHDPMSEIPSPELPWYADWRHWAGCILAVAVLVAIAVPIWQFIRLVHVFSLVGPT